MLRHRVAVPELPARYCVRAARTARCAPTRRRVTVLAAPGGFGKTTLLAATCRAEAARGVPVAWLNLADGEGTATLGAYLALAFHHAGTDLPAATGAGEVTPDSPHPRNAILLRALKGRQAPCVFVLGELKRVADPKSVALLDFLRTADDLRFSTPDIARFFDFALSRRELAEVAAASQG